MKTVNFLDEYGTRASMIVLSNLSDLTYKFDVPFTESVDFMKWLIITLDGDLTQRVDAKKCVDAYIEYRGPIVPKPYSNQ